MNEPLALVLTAGAGLLLGAFFFGGLWWTVRRGLSSRRPAILFLSSMLLRTGIVVAGFYFLGRGHWEQLVVALLGFVVARILITRATRSMGGSPSRSAGETSHAP